MESVQDTRKRDLERAERLLEQARPKTEMGDYDAPTIALLKEAMELFERWEMKEKLEEIYRHWAHYQSYISNFQISLAYAKKNLDICLDLYSKGHRKVAAAYYNLGWQYTRLQQPERVKEYVNKSLNIALKIADGNNEIALSAYNLLSNLQSKANNYLSAIDLQQKALAIAQKLSDDIMSLALIYNNLSTDYLSLGRYDQADKYLQLALKTILKITPTHKRGLNHIYGNLGYTYNYIGDYQKASYYYQKALRYRVLDDLDTANTYSNIGENSYWLNNYSESMAYLQRALGILQKNQIHKHICLINIYSCLSQCHFDQGNRDRALLLLEKAVEAAILNYGDGHVTQGRRYQQFASFYIKMGQLEKAKDYLEKVFIIFQKSKYLKRKDFPTLWNYWGMLLYLQKQHLEAIYYYHKAIRHLLDYPLSEDIYDHPFLNTQIHASQIKAPYTSLIPKLHHKAIAFQAYYQHDTQQIEDLEATHQAYWSIILLADYFRQSFLSEQSKLHVARELEEPLEGAVAAAYLRFEVLQKSQHLQDIFLLMEKGKANMLLMYNQEKSKQQNLGIPQNLLEKEQELKRKLVFLEKSIQFQEQKGEKTEKELLKQWKEEAFDVYNQFEKLKEQLEKDYPDYHRQNYSTDTVSISTLQSSLQENQTVLNYFIGAEKIYLFAITSDECEVFTFDKPSNWTDLIQNYLQSIKFHQKTSFLQYSFALYQILLQETMHHIIDPFAEEDEQRQIFIIPHAELHYLPFETLILQEANKSTPYSDLNYLLKNCQISYHYSATLLHLDLQKQAAKAERAPADVAFTGFAPVYASSSNAQKQALELLQKEYATAANRSKAVRGDGTWMPLPYSKLEVENIAQLFEQEGLKSNAFLYDKANKSNLEEQIGKSRFVLIAAHGVVNNQYPELSGLVLAEDGSGKFKSDTTEELEEFEEFEADRTKIELQKATDDCILNMKEVAMIPMNADLVVLSSCESGIGELHKGEGMMAVNRGFLASGAKNVVSTLFKVNDRASSELTTLLFGYILKGDDYLVALQKAKLKLLEREGMDPKSWSGFVLFGTGV